MTGLMSVTGFPDGEPVRCGGAITDVAAGLLAAIGTMTALLERETSGRGQWVQTSLLQAGTALMDFQAARYLIAGEVPVRVGNDHPHMVPTSAYRTADGYINVGTSGNAIWIRLCEAIGKPELAQRADYATPQARITNRHALNADLNAVFGSAPNVHWIERLNAAGVPCGPIYRVDEFFADEQARLLDLRGRVEHPRLGSLDLVNQMFKLSRTPATLRTPTPELGAHTDEILAEVGYEPQGIDDLRRRGVV
jgi:crotonobetainyl-CoA:carnitine CoA-transferase CaiB-like acyl-CoA transferase